MLEQLKDMLRQVVADEELFDLVAQSTMKYKKALIKAGFNEAEAMEIVASQGMGVKGS